MKANLNGMDNLAAAAKMATERKIKLNVKSAFQAAVEHALNRMSVEELAAQLSMDPDKNPGMFLYIDKSDIRPGLTDDDWGKTNIAEVSDFVTNSDVNVDILHIDVLDRKVKVALRISLAE